MKARRSVTFTLPAAMHQVMERVCKIEHRTTSELVREALRRYFAALDALPTYTATAAELAAIRKGRAAFRRGKVVTLDEFNAHVDRLNRKTRAQGPRARRSPRARAAAKGDQ